MDARIVTHDPEIHLVLSPQEVVALTVIMRRQLTFISDEGDEKLLLDAIEALESQIDEVG